MTDSKFQDFKLVRLIFVCLLFFCSQAVAQQVLVNGVIKSTSSGEPLAGVTIVADSISGALSDSIGNFSLSVSPGNHTLVFRLLGFKEFRKKIYLEGRQQESLSIFLDDAISELGVVVVTAGKHEQKIEDVTVSMEVIKPSLVENTNATSMESVIDQVPGVNVTDGQANIRGGAGWSYGAGSRVLILVDDIPQISADAGDAKWTFIPTENLEQVEVIKGASSALFGSSALNGVINFRTAYPKDTPQTRIGIYSGIYDKPVLHLGDSSYNLKWWGDTPQFISGINFLHSRKMNRFDLVAGGNVLIDDGYRQGEFEHRYRFNMNTRWRTKTEGLSLGINFNIQSADGSLFFIWKNDTTGAYIPADNTLSAYTNNKYSVDPFVTYFSKKGSSHKLRSRYFNTTNKNNTNQNSTAEIFFGEYQYQRKFKDEKFILTGGVAEQFSKVNSQLYSNHTGNNVAAYMQADAKIQKFNFSAGARIEHNEIDKESEDPQAVFRAGVNVHLFKETYLRASAGQGYRFPSVAERYVSTLIGNVGIYPNDSLEPETGFSGEVGIKQGIKVGTWKGYADVAFFLNRYNNMIEFAFAQWGNPVVDPLFGLGFRSVNVGNTEIRGAEFSVSGTGAISKNVQLDLLAGYTYINPRQTSYSDYYIEKVGKSDYMGSDSSNFLKYRYQHLVRADAEIMYRKLAFGVSARYNSFMVNIDKIFTYDIDPLIGIKHYRNHRTNGDLQFDSRISYMITNHWKAAFICKNIFNYIYMQRPADMQPPRTFVVQLNFSL